MASDLAESSRPVHGDRANSVRSAIVEPSNPFYLHHSNNPGLVLVSEQLTGDNYASWSRAMLIALSVKNKLCFIDGSILKPKDIPDIPAGSVSTGSVSSGSVTAKSPAGSVSARPDSGGSIATESPAGA
ncbi:hypothetical protein ACOSQ3_004769 [Xanthoceras sorbifolium]